MVQIISRRVHIRGLYWLNIKHCGVLLKQNPVVYQGETQEWVVYISLDSGNMLYFERTNIWIQEVSTIDLNHTLSEAQQIFKVCLMWMNIQHKKYHCQTVVKGHGNHGSTCSGQDLVWSLQHSVNWIFTGKWAKTNAIYPGLGKDHSRGHIGVSGGERLRWLDPRD